MTTDQLRAEAGRLFEEEKYQEAYEAYNRVIASNDDPLGEDFYDRAMAGLDCTPRVESAKIIQDLTEAIRLGFCVASAYNNRGCEFERLGEFDRAIEDFSEAIRLESPDSIYLLNRGRAYFKKKDFVNAFPDFSEAIGLNDEHVGICRYQRARSYVEAGELENAVVDFGEALTHWKPEYGYPKMDCLRRRAEACITLCQFEKALLDLEAVIAATPDLTSTGSEKEIDVDTWKSLELPLLRLNIGTSIVLCPKALMKELRNLDEWTAPRPELEIDQAVLFKMLIGQPQDLSEIRLVDYFSLFEDLGLHRLMYVVCKVVEELTDLRHVLRMLARKKKQPAVSEDLLFEEDDFSGCPFCQSCFNVLKSHSAAIRQDPELIRGCGRLDVFLRLDDSPVLIRTMPPFQYGDDACTTFVGLFRKHLRELAVEDPRPLSDVILCTSDGAEVSSYLGLLMCRSQFFARLMNFNGKEKADFLKNGRIHLEALSHSDLLELLHWIYRDEVDESASLQSCLRLLQFSAMHLESGMSAAFRLTVLDRIQRIPRTDLIRVVMETASSVLDLPLEPCNLSLLVKVAFAARIGLSDDGLGMIETMLNVMSEHIKISNESGKEEED